MTAYPAARYRAAIRRARRRAGYGSGFGVPRPVAIAAIGAVAVAMAGAGAAKVIHHHHHHGNLAPAIASVPAGGLGTRAGWARAFLVAIPARRTTCNMNAVLEWEAREGGGFGNQAAFNPLNVNPGPGAPWPGYSATGAWAFPNARTGLAYTVQTIHDGYYPGILAALRAGNNAQAVCNAIENSPWAASHYGYTLTASC